MIAGYRLVLASSVGERDGMGLEVTRESGARLAEVFDDSDTGFRVVNIFEPDVPVEVLEWLLAEARSRL